MIIRICKDGEWYNCELWQNFNGEFEIMNKSENVDEIQCNELEQGEQGFTDKLVIYLK